MLLHVDQKHYFGPPHRVEVHCDQLTDKALPQVQLSGSPIGPQTRALVSLIPECLIGMNILGNWQSPHVGSLTKERGSRDRKGSLEGLGSSSPYQDSKPHLTGNWSHKRHERSTYHTPVKLTNPERFGGMDDPKLTHAVVTPIAAALPAVLLYWSISMQPLGWMQTFLHSDL